MDVFAAQMLDTCLGLEKRSTVVWLSMRRRSKLMGVQASSCARSASPSYWVRICFGCIVTSCWRSVYLGWRRFQIRTNSKCVQAYRSSCIPPKWCYLNEVTTKRMQLTFPLEEGTLQSISCQSLEQTPALHLLASGLPLELGVGHCSTIDVQKEHLCDDWASSDTGWLPLDRGHSQNHTG